MFRYPKNIPLNKVTRRTYKYVTKTISMFHPYRCMAYETLKHERVKINCTYEGPVLDGKPYGLGFISYVEGNNPIDVYSFKGIGLMVDGDFHGGPALFIRGDGSRFLYSYMSEGRP